MDAIKSCSTKQQCSIKVYLRDILHPYVFLDFLASVFTSLLRFSTFHVVAQITNHKSNQITNWGGQTRTLLGASLYLLVFWIYYKWENRQMWQLITLSIRGKMFVKCFFIRWLTHRGHRGNLSNWLHKNWHHLLCGFCSTYDLVTEMCPSPIKRKLLFRYAEKKYNNTWMTCSKHLIAMVTL